MANRYCDTTIWDKDWFLDLSLVMKMFWKYFCDNCDHAGLWTISARKLKSEIDPELTIEQIMAVPAFAERFVIVDDKLFCEGFLKYQYKGELALSNSVHRGAFTRLKMAGIDPYSLGSIKVLQRPSQGLLDKDIDLDKDNSFKKEIEEILKSDYPLATGIGPGVEALLPQIKSPQDVIDLRTAAKSFKHFHIVKCRTDVKWIPQAKNWAKEWRDWVDTAGEKPSVNLVGVEHKKTLEEIATGSTDEGYQAAMANPEIQQKLARIGFRNKNKKVYENENE
jgi:hypothetical protein